MGSTTRIGFALVFACVFAWPTETDAQGGTYDVRQTNTQSSGYDEDGYRYSREARQSGSLGRTHVGMIGQDAHNVRTRIQWLGLGWGIADDWFGSAFMERDFGDYATLRVSAIGGWIQHDHGREFSVGGEVGVWLHSRSLEPTSEYLLLDLDIQSGTEYGPMVDPDGDGHYQQRRTSHLATSETGVTVPGYRSRMIGAELGIGTWWGYNKTREEMNPRQDRGLIGYAYAGFASGWVKSSMYYVQGFGTVGKSRYHRAFVHIMYAPLVTYQNLTDVDHDDQPSQFPIGLRLGVENMFGRRAAFTIRAEILALPAGGAGMALITIGFGSMFVSTS